MNRISDSELEHLLRIYEATAAQAQSIRVHHAGSVDIRTLKALRELKQLRAQSSSSAKPNRPVCKCGREKIPFGGIGYICPECDSASTVGPNDGR